MHTCRCNFFVLAASWMLRCCLLCRKGGLTYFYARGTAHQSGNPCPPLQYQCKEGTLLTDRSLSLQRCLTLSRSKKGSHNVYVLQASRKQAPSRYMCFYMCDVSATETAYHLNLEGYLATVEHYAAISETREVFGHILYD